jgi:hypothetical protein
MSLLGLSSDAISRSSHAPPKLSARSSRARGWAGKRLEAYPSSRGTLGVPMVVAAQPHFPPILSHHLIYVSYNIQTTCHASLHLAESFFSRFLDLAEVNPDVVAGARCPDQPGRLTRRGPPPAQTSQQAISWSMEGRGRKSLTNADGKSEQACSQEGNLLLYLLSRYFSFPALCLAGGVRVLA